MWHFGRCATPSMMVDMRIPTSNLRPKDVWHIYRRARSLRPTYTPAVRHPAGCLTAGYSKCDLSEVMDKTRRRKHQRSALMPTATDVSALIPLPHSTRSITTLRCFNLNSAASHFKHCVFTSETAQRYITHTDTRTGENVPPPPEQPQKHPRNKKNHVFLIFFPNYFRYIKKIH